ALRHGEVGGRVDVEVADALEVLHDRDAALLQDHVLEGLAAARDDDVDAVVASEEAARDVAPSFHELHGRPRQTGLLELRPDGVADGGVRRLRFGAPLPEAGGRGLTAEAGRAG